MRDLTFERDHAKDDRVLFAGDWHGNSSWAAQVVKSAAENGISLILHAGDFGVWPGKHGKRFLSRLDDICEEHGVDIAVTLGNHEDWGRLDTLWNNPKRSDEEGLLPLDLGTRHIRILPRVYRFRLGSLDFLSMGGAGSVDLDVRTEGRDWWPTEMISEESVQQAIIGGPADVMICHETPDFPYAIPKVALLLQSNPLGFSQRGLSHSAKSRRRLTRAFEEVRPRVLVHGHMHVKDSKVHVWPDGHSSNVIGLSEEYTSGNVLAMDLNGEHR